MNICNDTVSGSEAEENVNSCTNTEGSNSVMETMMEVISVQQSSAQSQQFDSASKISDTKQSSVNDPMTDLIKKPINS